MKEGCAKDLGEVLWKIQSLGFRWDEKMTRSILEGEVV